MYTHFLYHQVLPLNNSPTYFLYTQLTGLTADQVYIQVNERLLNEHEVWTGATSTQIKARVYEVKRKLNGGDDFTTVETRDEFRLFDDGKLRV